MSAGSSDGAVVRVRWGLRCEHQPYQTLKGSALRRRNVLLGRNLLMHNAWPVIVLHPTSDVQLCISVSSFPGRKSLYSTATQCDLVVFPSLTTTFLIENIAAVNHREHASMQSTTSASFPLNVCISPAVEEQSLQLCLVLCRQVEGATHEIYWRGGAIQMSFN